VISRTLSIIVAAVYVIFAYLDGGSALALKVFGFCLLPMFCIWWSDAMGGWTGARLGAPSITAESPGCIVHFLGWILLLAPIIAFLVRKFLI